MHIFIGSDHRGEILKKEIIETMLKENIQLTDTNLKNYDGDDYPDYAFEVGENVRQNENYLGILICGNGIGISIAANKVKGIRCARVSNVDDVTKAKVHNGANIIAFGSDIELSKALELIQTFIKTDSKREQRHQNRINKIINYENK